MTAEIITIRRAGKFLFLVLLSALWLHASMSEAATSSIPYKRTGVIPGTSLTYENLSIDTKGKATLIINNQSKSGVSFTANFTFYTSKGKILTAFSISGFANRKTRIAYAADISPVVSLKKAAYMKVLGRSGRSGGES